MTSLRSHLVVGVAGAAVLAGGVVTAVIGTGPTATDVANDYLAALRSGDVAKALSLSAHAADVDKTLLTTALPAPNRITDAKLGKVVVKDRTATASITYDVDGSGQSATLRLSKHGDDWRVDNGISSLAIDGAAPDVTSVLVNGVKVPVRDGSAEVPAIPGLYKASMPATFAFTAKGQQSPVTTDPGALHFDLTATAAGKAEAAAAVLRALRACLAKKPQTLEDPCHANTATITDKSEFKNSDYRWTLVTDPKLTAFASGATYEVSSTKAGSARVSVFAVDLKHRYPPQRITIPTPIALRGLTDVTFTGRKATVNY